MKKSKVAGYAVVLAWIVALGVMVYTIVQKHMMIEGTDYSVHAIKAIDIFQNGFTGIFQNSAYPIWRIGVKFFERILHFNLFDSAAWTTLLFYVLTYVIIFYIFCKKLSDRFGYVFCAMVSGILMLVQPISLEGLTFEVVSGRMLINTWHNPTNIVARPFGIVAVFLLFEILNLWENEKKNSFLLYTCFGFSLILANLGKPSFSQMFVPAVAIYFIGYCVCHKFRNFNFCFYLALSIVPSLGVLLLQTVLSFGGGEGGGGVEIAPFAVLGQSQTNIPLMLITTLAFPLAVVITNWKKCVSDKKVHIAVMMVVVSFLEYAMLAEVGKRRYHGNFGWGFKLAIFYFWMLALIEYCEVIKKEGINWKVILNGALLVLHLLCGIGYLWCQLGNDYFWV